VSGVPSIRVMLAIVMGVVASTMAADEPSMPERTAAIDELVALAAKTSLPTPLTIVCLGDSITAPTQLQPVKYPEMLKGALSGKYGERVKIVNAGKGGDNAESALKRLEADVLIHKPDLVFVNLGINDSKLTAQSDHARSQIPVERFSAAYLQILSAVKQAGGKVVAVGTIACVEEWTSRATQGEKKTTWFGKGEELVKYNAAARKVAMDQQSDYVDLYDHFRSQPDLKALFAAPDGVHCRDRGQEQIALQLMRYLVAKYPASGN
jgi:lysophospholipase L1-like esterase